MPMAALRKALPQGTDVHSVLNALRELAGEQSPSLEYFPISSRPWFSSSACSAATAVALCRLFGCPAGEDQRDQDKERLWLRLWQNRGLWSLLLPSGLLPTQQRPTWLQEASAIVVLGMHPREGVRALCSC
eukprot:m51a1_g10087 hypothetical protein (131) ;mRNA; f:84998-85390